MQSHNTTSFHLFPTPPSSPAFLYSEGALTSHIVHTLFTPKLRCSLCSAGLKPTQYSGHSFRCGEPTYTFCCGALVELISLQGTGLPMLSNSTLPNFWRGAFLCLISLHGTLFHYLHDSSPDIYTFIPPFIFSHPFCCLAVWVGHIGGNSLTLVSPLMWLSLFRQTIRIIYILYFFGYKAQHFLRRFCLITLVLSQIQGASKNQIFSCNEIQECPTF